MMGYGDFGSMGGVGWLWMALIVAAAIAVLVLAVRASFGSRTSTPESAPLDMLRRRFAAGEITADEFEQAKRAIA